MSDTPKSEEPTSPTPSSPERGNGKHVRKPETKEQELTQAVKMTFPASDPVALESDTVRNRKPKLVGVEEVLKQKAEEQQSPS